MDTVKDITANYKTQYLLIVKTDPPDLSPQPIRNPEGEADPANGWWYDASTNVTLSAQTIKDYSFNRWEVDGRVINGYSLMVHMDAPHMVIAYYTTAVAVWFVPDWFWWLLLLLILIILLLLILLYLRRRRKKREEAFYSVGLLGIIVMICVKFEKCD